MRTPARPTNLPRLSVLTCVLASAVASAQITTSVVDETSIVNTGGVLVSSASFGEDGEGVAIFLMDGATKIADNQADLWNGNLDHPLNIDENGTADLTGSVFTGPGPNGTQRTNGRIFGGSSEVPPVVTTGDVGNINPGWMVNFNAQTTSSLPVYAISEPFTVVDSADNTPPTLDSFLAGAVMTDLAGNLLEAGAASPDDTLITVDSPAPPYPVIQPPGSMILDTTLLSQCVGQFNEEDRWFFGATSDEEVSTINEGVYGGQFVKNAEAYDYLKEKIPLFDCPDPDFIKTYYYRWWTYRKHIKNLGTEGNPNLIVTEFIDPVWWADSTNAINAPLGHQIYEGRWLQDDRVMDDYQRYWLTNPAARPRNYSTWLADAVLANHRVNPDMSLLTELLTSTSNLENLESNHDKWVNGVGTGGGASLRSDGLFWQNDDRDAMEVSFGGSGRRPSINSYMYADARAIAEMFRLAASSDPANAATYNAKADSFDQQAVALRDEVQAHLWDPADEFFKTGYDDFDQGGSLHARREQIGFTPWAFGLPEDGGAVDYDLAWSHLPSFATPVGLTSGANDETGYNTGAVGQCCRWDGPVWPYATTITLRGLANLLQDYQQSHVDEGAYFEQLDVYTGSHRQQFTQDGQTRTIMWIDESMVSGGADAGKWTQIGITRDGTTGNDNPRGLAYNHSGYIDLIITGLAGLRPDTGDLVRVAPLLPDNTWDWFLLDNIRYHNRFLTILWDRTGAKYGLGAGFKVYADGTLIASAAGLEEVLGTLATTPDTLLTATNPPDDATDLTATSTSLTVTFNRPIQPGTGTIDLMRSTGGGDVLVESFNVASSPGLSFSGATVTITPTNPLIAASEYHVLIDATAIQGDSGTFFSGIADPTGWNFSTDGTPPTIITRTPPPGASAVSIRSDLTITFDEPVVKGSGTIVVRRAADDSAVQTIDVSHPDVTVDGAEVSVLLADLAVDTFYVEIADGAFTDLSGNPFAGISGSADWSFTTSPTAGVITASLLDEEADIENTGSALVSACHFQNPASGDPSPLVVNGIPHTVGRNNVANLTQNMSFEGDFRNGGSGLPQDGSDVIQVLLSGIAGANGITMSVSGLTVGREYLFQTYWEANGTNPQHTLVATIEGDTLNAIAPQGTPGGVLISYQFTAGDDTLNAVFDRDDGATTGDQNNWLSGYSLQEVGSTAGPALNATDPADDATGVVVTTNLIATFDKAVQPGTGSVALYKADGTLVEAIAVNDTTPPGTMVFTGSQVTIDPSDPLETGEDYYVLIGASAITDTHGNPFEGITDATVWNFSSSTIALESALGVLDLSANGGINPATGSAWQAGDTYRLVFLTSQTTTATSADITTYNAFVQGVAASSSTFPNLGAGTWKVVGSTATVDARDNTGTNPETDGDGVAVFLMDGATAIANNNTDLWNGISHPVGLNENGSPDYEMRVFTGTLSNGTKVTGTGDQPLGSFGTGLGNIRAGESSKTGGSWMTDFNASHDTQHKVFAMSEPLSLTATAGESFADFMNGFPGVGVETGFTDDPDGDRLPNGVEAFFGTAPDSPNAGFLEGTFDDGSLTFSHPEAAPQLTDVTGSYEWSLDLSGWNDSGDEVAGTIATISAERDTPESGTTTVTLTVTGTEPGRVFIRVAAMRE